MYHMNDINNKRKLIPKTVMMSHGSGGQDSALLMREIFSPHFSNDILDHLDDGAVLPEKLVVSTDSFVVSPLIFPGGDIGKLAICGTVNDVLMMGAIPKYLSCAFIIEEGFPVDKLDCIVLSMADTAKAAGIKIVTGDTKVIERGAGSHNGTESGLFINTTGLGHLRDTLMHPAASRAKPGDAVIVSGNLGDHHACILSARMGIENDIISDCAVLSDIVSAALDASDDIHVMRDITRGGLATVLNEIAASAVAGDGKNKIQIQIDEDSIPVAQNVQALCGIMGLDPLYMGNEGKLVCICPESDAQKTLAAMRQTQNGENARIIGRIAVCDDSDHPVIVKTEIGGSRRLGMLVGEGLPRIC